jgi:hypothetical protein
MRCLTEYKGGLCARSPCSTHAECPEPGLCVVLEDSTVCLRLCVEKAECNASRSAEDEANCSSNLELVEPSESKVCVPPNSG